MNRAIGTRLITVTLAVAAACALGACNKSGTSPVSPSLTSTASVPTSAGVGSVTVTGQVNGASASSFNARSAATAPGMSVSIAGSNLTSGIDSNGRFRLAGAPAGNLALQFTGAGVDARVPIGQVNENEKVDVQVTLAGTTGTVEASEHVRPDDGAEVEGRIAAIDNSARTLHVGSSTVRVSSQTRITSRGTSLRFEDLRVQLRVHVSGSMQGDGVEATQIEVEDAVTPSPSPQPDPDPAQNEAEFTGAVSSVGGTCPAVSLTVAGRVVKTSSSTVFLKTTCSGLSAGMSVEVKGVVSSDGSVAASRVQLEDDVAGAPEPEPEGEVEFTGVVSSRGGTCPAITLTVASTVVTSNSATEFDKASCSSVVNGVTAEIKGTRQSNGSVLASRIRVESSK